MFLLESDLAQQIVDRTMAIIGRNINVMNQSGVIIGSGDKQRLSETHDGALLALKHGKTFEITEEGSQALTGVKPGINMVLQISDQIIGVIGITGEPDKIRDYANLVKITAEMIVERAALTEQLQWDRRHREEFITAWIEGDLPGHELVDWAKRLGIDLCAPRVALIIRFRDNHEPMNMEGIRKVIDILERHRKGYLVAMDSMQEIVILRPVSLVNGELDRQLENSRLNRLLRRLQEYEIKDIHVSLGDYFEGPEKIPLSYASSKLAMEAGLKKNNNCNKHLYYELRLPVLFSPLRNSWQGEKMCRAFRPLRDVDKNGQLVKTLIALFEHHSSLAECAKNLHIHRNTLRYRIKKIQNITYLNPENLEGLMELYIGCLLEN